MNFAQIYMKGEVESWTYHETWKKNVLVINVVSTIACDVRLHQVFFFNGEENGALNTDK